jgi:translation elongation factor EF-4
MVFGKFVSRESDDFDACKSRFAKIKTARPALVFEPEMKEALGRGFNCGFWETLHIEIFLKIAAGIWFGLVISHPRWSIQVFESATIMKLLFISATDWPDQSK